MKLIRKILETTCIFQMIFTFVMYPVAISLPFEVISSEAFAAQDINSVQDGAGDGLKDSHSSGKTNSSSSTTTNPVSSNSSQKMSFNEDEQCEFKEGLDGKDSGKLFDAKDVSGKYIYRQGCEFKNQLANVEKLDPAILDEIVMGLFAILSVASIVYKTEKIRSLKDCPKNRAHLATLRINQAASLSYLIGTKVSNHSFKKETQKIISANFSPDGKSEDIAEQTNTLKSYDAVIGMYQQQQKLMKAKIALDAILEGALISSTTTEAVNMTACMGMCTKSWGAVKAKAELYEKLSDSAGGTILGLISANSVSAAGAACLPLSKAVAAAIGNGKKDRLKKAAKTAKLEAEVKFESSLSKVKEAKQWGIIAEAFQLPSNIQDVFLKKATTKAELERKKLARAKKNKMIKDAAKEAADETSSIAIDSKLIGALHTTWKTCQAGISSTYAAACTGPQAVVTGKECVQATALQAALPVPVRSFIKSQGQLYNIVKKTPLVCCGGNPGKKGTNLRTSHPLPPGKMGVRQDIEFSSLNFMKGILKVSQNNTNLDDTSKFAWVNHLKAIVENAIVTKRIEKLKFFPKNIKQNQLELAKVLNESSQIERVFELISQSKTNMTKELISKSLYNQFGIKNNDIAEIIYQVTATIKNVNFLLPKTAHAEWTQHLMFGVVVITLGMLLENFIQTKLYSTPVGRISTWAVLSGMMGVMLHHHKKVYNKVKRRKEVVMAEREKWLNAAVGKTQASEGEAAASSKVDYNKVDYKASSANDRGEFSCGYLGTNGTFIESSCPPPQAKNKFKIPQTAVTSLKKVSPSFSRSLANLTSFANNASTKGNPFSGMSSADISGQGKLNHAMRKQMKKSVDLALKRMNKGKKKSDTSYVDISKRAANVLKGIKGKNFNTGAISSSLASAGTSSRSSGSGLKTIGSKKQAGQVPSFSSGKDINLNQNTNGLDSLDFEDEDTALADSAIDEAIAKEENLEDFKVDHNDINKKKEVSLFRILSNRYLLSYDKVLKQKKLKSTKNLKRVKK